MANTIDKQILATAGYHNPSQYADLLTLHSSYEQSQETVSQQFIPLSTVRGGPDGDLRLFVIGVIPPSTRVSDRKLDRSASVAALSKGVVANEADLGPPPTGGGSGIPGRGDVNGRPLAKSISPGSTAHLPDEFFTKLAAIAKKRNFNAEDALSVMYCESGVKANGPIDGTATGIFGLQFNTKEEAEEFRKKTPVEQLDDYDRYMTPYSGVSKRSAANLYQLNFLPGSLSRGTSTDTVLTKQGGTGYNGQENLFYTSNKNLDYRNKGTITVGDLSDRIEKRSNDGMWGELQQRIRKADPSLAVSPVSAPQPLAPPTPPSTYQAVGSQAAKDAQKAKETRTISGYNQDTKLGQQFQQAQQRFREQLRQAYNDLEATPPLRFLVNPASLSINNEKLINDGERSRHGSIIEHWGDNQDTLDVSGKVGAFYALDVGQTGFADGGPGITRNARIVSAAYQNFLSLFHIYKNNAGIFLGDKADTASDRTNLVMLGSIYIYYDNTMYIGSFDSFSVTEDEGSPYTLEYSFQFTVRATFSTGKTPEPSSYNLNQDPRTIRITR